MLLKFPDRSSAVVHKLWLVEHFQTMQIEASSGKVLSCARLEETAAGASIAHSAAASTAACVPSPVPPQPLSLGCC